MADQADFVRVESDLTCVTQANLGNDSVAGRGWVMLEGGAQGAESPSDAMAEVHAAQTAAVLREQQEQQRRKPPLPTPAPPEEVTPAPPAAEKAAASEPAAQEAGAPGSTTTTPPAGGHTDAPAATASSYVRRCDCLGASAGHHRPACAFSSS
jgi:hypothetical protein